MIATSSISDALVELMLPRSNAALCAADLRWLDIVLFMISLTLEDVSEQGKHLTRFGLPSTGSKPINKLILRELSVLQISKQWLTHILERFWTVGQAFKSQVDLIFCWLL
jgi:hypothetical protein